MLWGTHVHASVSVEAFLLALQRHGFVPGPGTTIAGLEVLDHGDSGHRVVYIPRTGRLQIRLDPLTRHDDRIEAANRLYKLVRVAAFEAAEISLTLA